MAYIGKTPTIGNFQVCDAISVVNGQAAYTMQVGGVNVSPESANHMIVSLNGVIQKPNSSFTVSGSTITFSSNLATGDVIDFIQILGDVLDLGVPSDATVTTAKLADGAVTNAKLASGSFGNITSTGTLTNFTSTGIDDNATSTAITISSDERVTIDADDEKALVGMNNNATNSNEIGFDSTDFIVKPGGTERLRLNTSGHAKAVAFTNRSTILNTINPTVDDTNSFEIANGYIHLFRDDTATIKNIIFGKNGSEVGSISTNGSSTSYNTSSDYRLKENVIEIANATTRLKLLKPSRFNFIADADTTVDGFLAHEVSNIVPEAVSGTHNGVKTWTKYDELPEGVSIGDNKLDDDGNTIPEYQGIDQSKLVPLLVKTIQELEARITELENA
jgi:hypothetical protein